MSPWTTKTLEYDEYNAGEKWIEFKPRRRQYDAKHA